MTVEAAAKAIKGVVTIRHGVGDPLTPTRLIEMWFPPSLYAFTEAEAREALADLLHSGAVVMDEERHLRPGGEGGGADDNG